MSPGRAVAQRVRSALVGGGLRLLARTTPWIESELAALSRIVRPGGTCLDIGAAAGFYTAELARLVGVHGVVHSVEPLRFAHALSSNLLGLRSAPNVRRHSLALSSVAGEKVMSVPLRRGRPVAGRSFVTFGSAGMGSNAEFSEHMRVVVDSGTLDEFCREQRLDRLDFVKVDVEGAELEVLNGGANAIEALRPAVLIEVEDRHLSRFGRHPDDVVEWFTDRDYGMSVWSAGDWRPVQAVTDEFRNYLFTAAR